VDRGHGTPLYVLPSDHRASFERMFGRTDALGADRTACGRTHHVLPALVDWRAQQITRGAAVTEIARRYREWVGVFEQARGA